MSAHFDISSITGECCCCPRSAHLDGTEPIPGVPCDYCKSTDRALDRLVRPRGEEAA